MAAADKIRMVTCLCGIIGVLLSIVPAFFCKIKWINPVMLIGAMISVFYFTIAVKTVAVQAMQLTPLWSYQKWDRIEIRGQILQNIFLFMPYGALLKANRIKHPIAMAFLTSLVIEISQYIFSLGLCETDDVINNTIGAAVGCRLYKCSEKYVTKYGLESCLLGRTSAK